MPASSSALLYVGIKHSVVALDAHSGEIVWEAELPGSSMATSSAFITLHVAGGLVYAARAGEVAALDAHTGAEVWRNELKGYGLGFATLATAEGSSGPGAATAATTVAQQAAAAAATSAAVLAAS